MLQAQPAPSTSRSTSNEHRPKLKRPLDDTEHAILLELKKWNASNLHQSRSDQEILLLFFRPHIRDMKSIKQRRVSHQQPLQQRYVHIPFSPRWLTQTPTKSLLQSFDSQSPPVSNTMEQFQQEQPSQRFWTNYAGTNKYQQLCNEAVG